jgi:SAM-dependent methyltransferase
VTWPSFPPPRYLGQLDPGFQAALAAERSAVTREECSFYHTVETADGEVVMGPWDLRGREREYLGGVDFSGRRVLELGPATGALTQYLEDAGADVVGFDAGFDVSIDLHPDPTGADDRARRLEHAQMVGRVQRSWWYLHSRHRCRAAMVYGDIYTLPGDIGQFDISVFAAILLHLRSPVAALTEAARRTREAIVVTESWGFERELLHENVMKIFPYGDGGRWTVWWSISAGAVVSMLETLGFADTTVTEHEQLHQFGHDAGAPYRPMPMYTVVGRRA